MRHIASTLALLLAALLGACGSDDRITGELRPDAVIEPGFGQPCSDDAQCPSGPCVPHAGSTYCSQLCSITAPCPDGWSCWSPPGSAPEDAACASPFFSLCRPCSADADCAGVATDAPGSCVDYDGRGSFCGTPCTTDAQCPDGFGCLEAVTLAGEPTTACVSDYEVCACNPYIQGLGEVTQCHTDNDFGSCPGERACVDGKLWTPCDSQVPAPDIKNGLDDDCDGETDELNCACGDRICDGTCGETVTTCPCDCAVEGDGVCSPCGESPATSPVDCCRSPGGGSGCGDGYCLGFGCGENAATCPRDCSTPCGNTVCEPGENPFNCAEDCKRQVCGNNVCEPTDGGPEACPQDCKAYCGDCECDPARDESVFNCPIDCGHCGDGSCSPCGNQNEDALSCAADCCVGGPEVCNGEDDDCDGQVDEADAAGCRPYYGDADKDGLGRWDQMTCLCTATDERSALTLGDCDDDDALIGLGAPESCNAADDDCDGQTDEGFDLGARCDAPGGPCLEGIVACDGPDRTTCVNGPAREAGSICSPLTCEGGVIAPPGVCDGLGACSALPLLHCDGHACDALGRCETTCASDDDCREGYACGVGGECEQTAYSCTSDAECVDEDWHTIDFCLVICGHRTRPGAGEAGDVDSDGVPNNVDLCPETPDPDQLDADDDAIGDACDRCDGAGSTERCNGKDDDCDGQIDEGFGVGATCVADGDPCRYGRRECNAQGATSCPAASLAPAGVACGPATCVGDSLRLASRCDGNGACKPGEVLTCHGYDCQAGATNASCKSSCTSAIDCSEGYRCVRTPLGGECAPKLADGATCASPESCASGNCVDGVCCATACTADCYTCANPAALGTCTPEAAGLDPADDCGPCGLCDGAGHCADAPAGPSPKGTCPVDAPCGATGACDAEGRCLVASAETSCAETRCVNGFLTSGTTCDGLGACRELVTTACPGALTCADASTCRARCASDNHCVDGHFCDEQAGACAPRLALGKACGDDGQCQSGMCVEGLCCESRCEGTCLTCAAAEAPGLCVAIAAGEDPTDECGTCRACNGAGACTPSAAGSDPDDDCAARPPCGTSGTCDGQGACAYTASTVSCGAPVCVGSSLVEARTCDGEGSCEDPTLSACVAFRCDDAGTACRTTCASDAHCQSGFFCDSDKVCKARLAGGASCARPEACASGFCVDGRCCDSACSGTCRTCDGAQKGVCSPLDGVEDGACAVTSICESGACRRVDGERCEAGSECASGVCADGTCCASRCDGECDTCSSGVCEPVLEAQLPGECDRGLWCTIDQACEAIDDSACVGDTCPEGRICKGGLCTLPAALGTSCVEGRECASGACVDGVCCESACEGTCRQCNATGRCGFVPAGSEGPTDCVSENFTCDGAGTCKAVDGKMCGADGECASGRCVDGACCPEACDGECESCALGACKPVVDLPDPDTCPEPSTCFGRDQCVTAGGTPCAGDGECTSNHCVLLTADRGFCCDTPCADRCDTCVGSSVGTCERLRSQENPGQCDKAEWCDANGVCTPKVGADCAGGKACPEGTWCNPSDSRCAPLAVLGVGCPDDAACASGHCVDGRCCESACDGACERCDVDSAGGCLLVPTDTDPDGDCPAGEVCSREAGGCAAEAGAPCATGAECASGYCVEGVCCDQACGGLCQTCVASPGMCTTVTNGASAECNGGFACDARGECALAAGRPCRDGADCASGLCAGGVCCAAGCDGACETCNADGSCGLVKNADNPGRCELTRSCDPNGVCLDDDRPCTTNAGCPADHFCQGNLCVPDLAVGASCADSPQCASGFCVDNACCESDCHGTCETCRAPGFEGQCVPSPVDWNPHGSCPEGFACNANGSCSKRKGTACDHDSQCLSGFCVDGVCCSSDCNEECMKCNVANAVGTCTSVSGADDTCMAPRSCVAGDCKLALAERCAEPIDCASGFCADATQDPSFLGVCCDLACTGPCLNCDPVDGRCVALTLTFEPGCTEGRWCDRSGACRLPAGSSCATDSECPSGLFCNGSTCEPKRTNGQTCGTANACVSGFCADGRCCNEQCSGACDSCLTGTCNLLTPGQKGDCPTNMACSAGGGCAKGSGQTCSADGECASGFCANGVCCTSECEGLCKQCDLSGTCQAVVNAVDPTSCFGPMTCNAVGECKLGNGQSCTGPAQCASGKCVDGMCCNSDCTNPCESCNQSLFPGVCSKTKIVEDQACGASSWCGPSGACVGKDGQTCTTTSECAAGYWCDKGAGTSGTCRPLGELGQSCSGNQGCKSGFCADGVCCSEACTGLCLQCNIPGRVGSCGFTPAGVNDGCTNANDACNGRGLCQKMTGRGCGTNGDCISGFCAEGVCCSTSCDGVCERCDVTPGTCTGVESGPDARCGAPFECDGRNRCLLSTGQPCASPLACASNFCADGVCCGTACNEDCQACDLPNSLGQCKPVDHVEDGMCVETAWCLSGLCGPKTATACLDDNACPDGYICFGSLCTPPLVDGSTCGRDGHCASGHCVEGVCCDSTCNNECESCNLGGSRGKCTLAPARSDPGDRCGELVCSVDGRCVGDKGSPCFVDNDCGSGYCVDQVCCESACSDCFDCNVPGVEGSCVAVAGDDGVCSGPLLDCQAGRCALQNGADCTNAPDCLSGICTDGTCCATTCSGPCETCEASGTAGTCTIVKGADTARCTGVNTCSPSGQCLKKSGQSCGSPIECASGVCNVVCQ